MKAISHLYVDKRYVNIGLGNGLLPDSTKPLPDQILTYHQQGPIVFIPAF